MIDVRACIDVDDMDKAIAFYTAGIGLSVGRRFESAWVEMLGATLPIDLLCNPPGTAPCACDPALRRDYRRHWTPTHLDFVVPDLEIAVDRVRALGATLDRDIQERPWGRMANLGDPFGNGFCLLEFRGGGYDAMSEAAAVAPPAEAKA